jgi:hypothetical protein
MSSIQQHQTSSDNPEEVTSAMNSAFAEFLAVEPTLRMQQSVNLTSINELLTTETTHSHNNSSRPSTANTQTYSSKIIFALIIK